MLKLEQKNKLAGVHDWKSNQEKANFNKNMRRKLKLWLKELPDMVLLLDNLPPRVLDNAKLIDDLPKVIEFVDTFLEKADPLPVAEHESGEKRTFRNYATCMENHPDVDGWKSHIKNINGKRYLIDSYNLTASPADVRYCDILKEHIEDLQRYVDPSIVVIDDSEERKEHWDRACDASAVLAKMSIRKNMMGRCGSTLQVIREEIPTKPPCKPRALIDGKLYDIPISEEEEP